MKTLASLIIFSVFLFPSCSKDFKGSTGMIIAWEVDDDSRLWIRETETNKICEIKTGKWREPKTGLGTTVEVDVYENVRGNLKGKVNVETITYDARDHWNNPMFAAYFTALKEYENIER